MDRNDIDWRGYFPAFITPFREDGALDLVALRALVDHYVEQGMHGIMVNGTCGEWFAQTTEERRIVAEAAVEQAAGRLTVLVGCTAYTAAEAAGIARHALDAGADGVISTPPPYAKPFPDETVAYYRELGERVDGPIAVYNWPHGTSVDIGPELASRLADLPHVVAIKDSTPDAEQFYATTRAVVDRIRVFGPFMTRRGLEVLRESGGDGTVGGGSLAGRPDPTFWEDVWAGDFAAAEAYADVVERLFPKLWLPGGWAGHWGAYQSQLKVLMGLLGQPTGHVRPPRLPITDPEAIAAMRAVLVEEGLLDADPPAAA
ncbi:dihydrodipicolinate synthase family protein [Patulibacter defluvii]|uniref:dihydrodipicolinate synthase family protein n=1 Tax=Patulibacter defluvii TaxID=3095358 RepID=UPI002A7556B6|nr:dihydrodipicolinate synthase family protein [Patulibacter sp. DM4]